MNILRSESTGSIHVSSKAPNMPPAIRFNFLSAQLDREVTCHVTFYLKLFYTHL
jgi:choline dehydrogenase